MSRLLADITRRLHREGMDWEAVIIWRDGDRLILHGVPARVGGHWSIIRGRHLDIPAPVRFRNLTRLRIWLRLVATLRATPVDGCLKSHGLLWPRETCAVCARINSDRAWLVGQMNLLEEKP